MRTTLICLCLVLAGCGQKKEAPPAPPRRIPKVAVPTTPPQPPPRPVLTTAPNACTVLDEALAKRHLGDDAKMTRHMQANQQISRCQWSGGKGTADVLVGDWSAMHTKSAKDVLVPGFGDEAYETPVGLVIRKGEYGVQVKVVVNPGMLSGAAAAAEAAAEKAGEREIAPDLLSKL